ncbi:MAG: DUF2779 domain-containing protein [Nanoarchaeota archaeon]|nr:DUF2779 domain-containing protein [Nanoarchaeota archaeon]MBU1269858.1 DUF2779 domain-containing protein [Nanoarchaeota archaeon]MBU1603789.1 DUF2779 domain-containing protein [Nanoarchaeota archaeon]MBU2442708.1 DUF2779 domain-containing protein [Nanoarchaeota archaeon]
MTSKTLTKSLYMVGLQCDKYLWTKIHEPNKITSISTETKYRFEQGKLVGELAKKMYSEGVNIPTKEFMENVNITRKLARERKTLFEAGILADEIYTRADILKPVGIDEWDLIEVKSSTEVKKENIEDVAFQKYCCKKAGLNIKDYFLMYVNKEFVKNGVIKPEEFFATKNITSRVNEASIGIEKKVDELLNVLASTKKPYATIGKRCGKPYNCPLTDDCWSFMPQNNVFDLYRGGKKSTQLFEEDILAIANIPDDFKLSDKQEIQREVEITGKPYVNKKKMKEFLKLLKEPLQYLDFETISPVMPIFNGTRPYQKIPFQFSLHTIDSSTKHFSFLYDKPDDPRPAFLSSLKDALGKKGKIIVYNQVFEKGIINELGGAFSEYRNWADSTLERVVDLLVPFRNFDYYNSSQHGSASIKKVLPALIGRGYEAVDIKQGMDASLEYLRITYPDINGVLPSREEIEKVRANLEEYCSLDTKAMILIVDELRRLVK